MIAGMGFAQMAWKEAFMRVWGPLYEPSGPPPPRFAVQGEASTEYYRICDDAQYAFAHQSLWGYGNTVRL